MKTGIHPEYVETKVHCSCGNEFTTRSTRETLTAELCNECHPFYTGKQKLVDTGGRVERFRKRTEKADTRAVEAKRAKRSEKVAGKRKTRDARPTSAAKASGTTPGKAPRKRKTESATPAEEPATEAAPEQPVAEETASE